MDETKDRRPWRTTTLKLPEPIAILVEEALFVAQVFGLGGNRIEAWEAIAGSFLAEYSYAAAYAELRAKDPYRVNALAVLKDCGFRCILCETSQNLHIHHAWPRSYHGPERPEDIHAESNLMPICLACHEKVHKQGWRKWIATLLVAKQKAINQVRNFGFRMTMRHSGGKGKRWS